MTPKEIFQKDKELTKKFNAVASADWFKKCLAFAKAEMWGQPNMNADKLAGAQLFEQLLCELATIPSEPITFTHATVDHGLDNPAPTKPETK